MLDQKLCFLNQKIFFTEKNESKFIYIFLSKDPQNHFTKPGFWCVYIEVVQVPILKTHARKFGKRNE